MNSNTLQQVWFGKTAGLKNKHVLVGWTNDSELILDFRADTGRNKVRPSLVTSGAEDFIKQVDALPFPKKAQYREDFVEVAGGKIGFFASRTYDMYQLHSVIPTKYVSRRDWDFMPPSDVAYAIAEMLKKLGWKATAK